jgi:hypothetical protein
MKLPRYVLPMIMNMGHICHDLAGQYSQLKIVRKGGSKNEKAKNYYNGLNRPTH